MKSFSTLVLLITLALSFASYSHAFTALHPDFKEKFAPDDLEDGVLSTTTRSVPDEFKAFVPPGAKRASIIIYGPRNGMYGAISRVDNPPQCTYGSVSEKKAEKLPWNNALASSLLKMRKRDCQVKNMNGRVQVISWSMAPLSVRGHWVYVKIVNYAGAELEKVKYTVHVDESKYTDWFESASWSGNQPPDGGKGPTGGHCDPKWRGSGSTP